LPKRASGVGTGEKVLVSCFIIAIRRRMSGPLLAGQVMPVLDECRNDGYMVAIE
jgi:hypothetical protein